MEKSKAILYFIHCYTYNQLDPATIRNVGQNFTNHGKNDKSAVVVEEAYRNLHDRHLTAIALTLLKIYVETSPLT